MEKSMSPSQEPISSGKIAKFIDLQTAALRKSNLPVAETQYVLENQGADIADAFVTDVRRRVEARQRAIELHLLQRKPFDPEKFIGKGWKVDEQVGKRTGGNLDAGQITRKDYLKSGESYINGEERLKRIKAAPDDIQMDGEDFLALYEEKGQLTLRWLYDTKGITWLSFWGIILRRPSGDRNVLYLCRHGGGSWDWSAYWVVDDDWNASDPSAVLAS